ncbi:PKD domain containing protein [Thermoanaerobacterium thermosaccharolyticum DSM 571]|uniref:PKD domain containing protein n=2 Tax=Thermoanaerobacterium thermosaccharolyticum TaxID=1517 RepID=D9TQR1_THETC|nr:PKD domain containing protein [Thermoanaerobacterium thermosaccharolyticum DSM 571]
MSKRFKRILSIITLITFLTGLIYMPKSKNVYAAVIDDSGDLNLAIDTPVTITAIIPFANPIPPKSNDKKLYSGKWNVMVDGTLAGYDKVVRHIYSGGSAEQYNFIKYSTIPQWITAFGGNPSFVNTYLSQIKLNISGSDRVYIRYLTELCGAHVTGYKVLDEKGGKGEVYVATTRPPSANISISPANPKENDNVKIMVSGTSFFNFWNTDLKNTLGLQDKIVYTVDIDGQRVISAKTLLNQQNFTDTIAKTFNAGQHTITLYVRDAVDRLTRKDFTFTVSAAATPPPPPGNIQAGINLTLDPPSLKIGTTGNVNATIDASSSVSSGTGPFGARFWLQVNGTDLLGSDGTVLQNLASLSQAKYTKLISNAKPGDKVWAKVRVYDQSINKTSEVETTKIIGQYEDAPTPEPTPPPAPTPVPPVAGINAPSEVIQGDDVRISSSSYDPDGVITNYSWGFSPSSGIEGSISGDSGTISFSNIGTYTIKLTVTDNDGLKDTAEKQIEVKPAIPEAFFDYTGALKENRKVVLDASGSYTSPKYPMVWDATEWEITPVSSGLTQDDIKIVSSTDMKTRTVLFKKAGDYKVRVKVKNSAGNYSDWYEKTLTVVEDLPPVADFFVMTTALRDPANSNMAKIQLIDASYSPDGDKIVQRIWKYKYDSNNDGNFDDEQWVTLDSGNNVNLVLYTKDVGKYLFELSVKEDFGEETIPEFVSPSDYKTADTSNKPMKDKICEVINLQPVVDFEMYEKKKAELVIRVGKLNNYDARVKQLEDGINNLLIPLLKSKNIDVKVIDSDFGTGTYGGNTSFNGSQYTVSSYIIKATVDTTGRFGVTTVEGFPGITTDDNKFLLYAGDVSGTSALVVKIDGNLYNLYGYTPTSIITSDGKITVNYGTINGVDIQVIYTIYDDKYVLINFVATNKTNVQKNIGFKIYYDTCVAGNDGSPIKVVDKGFEIYNDSYQVRAVGVLKNNDVVTPPTDWRMEHWSSSNFTYFPYDDGIPHYSNSYYVGQTYQTSDTAISLWWHSQEVSPNQKKSITTLLGIERPTEAKLSMIRDSLLNTVFSDLDAGKYVLLFDDLSFLDYSDDNAKTNFANTINQLSSKLIMAGQTSFPTSQADGLIGLITDGGFKTIDDNISNQLTAIANYIAKDLENQQNIIEKYVVLGEPIDIKTYYNDPENDPKYQERWMYIHDPNYFENSLGLADFNEKYLNSPVTVFDKVGKYEVQYQARDNPKDDDRFDNYRLWSYKPLSTMYIYVHRRPIAQFAVSMTPSGSNYVVSIADQSYDLDHMSLPNKGIQAWEWKWKEVNEATWHDGKMSGTFPVGNTYLVYLRVQDLEGAWSEPKVQTITTQNINLPPVAQFTVNPITQVINKTVTITDQSYDPNGDPIAEWQWRVQKPDGTWINYGGTMPNNISSLGVGTYTIELKVRC